MPLIDLIAFDADDTLWVSEPRYIAAQAKLCDLLVPHATSDRVMQVLHETEVRNLPVYGYGVKGFLLSMLETALRLSAGYLPSQHVEAILAEGKQMLTAPIALFEHVRETLNALACSRKLMLLTKGDLFEQEERIRRSGLAEYFTSIEIVSEKSAATYQSLLQKYHVAPGRFLMVGNSLKSDILPVVAIGGRAVYIHYENTWAHEKVDNPDQTRYECIDHIGLLPDLLRHLETL